MMLYSNFDFWLPMERGGGVQNGLSARPSLMNLNDCTSNFIFSWGPCLLSEHSELPELDYQFMTSLNGLGKSTISFLLIRHNNKKELKEKCQVGRWYKQQRFTNDEIAEKLKGT